MRVVAANTSAGITRAKIKYPPGHASHPTHADSITTNVLITVSRDEPRLWRNTAVLPVTHRRHYRQAAVRLSPAELPHAANVDTHTFSAWRARCRAHRPAAALRSSLACILCA